jgi:hypothetical protein
MNTIKQYLCAWAMPPDKVTNKEPWRTVASIIKKNNKIIQGDMADGDTLLHIDRNLFLVALWLYRS